MKRSIGKTVLSWLLVISMIIPSLSYVIHAQAADGDIKDYDAMTMEEILASEESLTWVFAGDSITHNGNWSQGMNSYSEWFEQYLYDIDRGSDSVVLTAWGGAHIRDFQTEANTPDGCGTKSQGGLGLENMITKYNPDVVFIKTGMNDRGMSTADFISWYGKMLDGIYAEGEKNGKKPKVILLAPTPLSGESNYDDRVNPNPVESDVSTVRRHAVAIEGIAKERGLDFVNLRKAFLDEQDRLGGAYRRTIFSDPSDGAIHPNASGQYLIFKTICKTLEIYKSEMPIFQIEYADINGAALYVDDTSSVTYTNGYDTPSTGENSDVVNDEDEMNATMPSITGVEAISSVEFTSNNGVLDMGNSAGFSISSQTDGVNTLTQAEASALEDSFTVVFRARLGSAYNTNQPVLFVSSAGTANWQNALVLGVPGQSNQLYFNVKAGKMTAKNGVIGLSSGTTVAGDGNWHTIATVYDAGTIKYYVDGTQVGDTISGYGLAEGVESLGSLFADSTDFQAQIGRYGISADGTSYKLNGKFDYWQFYGQALTADQVAKLSGESDDTQSGVTRTHTWAETVSANYVWAVAGAEQMSGYEGPVVNRSIFRLLDNVMRGAGGRGNTSDGKPPSENQAHRDIRFVNLAEPGNNVATMSTSYETTIGEHAHNVLLLLPEVSDVYKNGYNHATGLVEQYKEDVEALIAANTNVIPVLWTPLASNDATINGYIDDYADAVREIATENGNVLFYDANKFMNENMESNKALTRNWFEDDMYVSPLCATDLVRSFYATTGITKLGTGELTGHNLRATSDVRKFKSEFVRDYIKANSVTVSGENVIVDITDIKAAYTLDKVYFAVMPVVGTGNNHEDIYYIDANSVAVEGNKYTFTAPCSNPVIAIYGKFGETVYRFKDFSVDVTVANDITLPTAPEKVELSGLKVVGTPNIEFKPETLSYDVTLYQYQQFVQVLAEAAKGLTITVNGTSVESGEYSQVIDVDKETAIEVKVTDGAEEKTYTLNVTRPEYPDIIVTEVMQDGYGDDDIKGGDNYELIEIYNASGKTLNLKDYSIGYKKEFRNSNMSVSDKKTGYYFTGNNQAFQSRSSNSDNVSYTAINQITKYSSYWSDDVKNEPDRIDFPADSTMVIWVKFVYDGTDANGYGKNLTYDTLIQSLGENKDEFTLSVDGEAVVPDKQQLVVAEVPKGVNATAVTKGSASTLSENASKNFYLDNYTAENQGGNLTRSWLFVLDKDAEQAKNASITEAGDDIISATRFVRLNPTNKLSSVFSYNTERGMSLVKDETYYDKNTIGQGHTSDQQGYSNKTSFGAIEYWQKPADLNDKINPTVVDKTVDKEVAVGSEVIINLDLADETDVRYATVYARKAGEKDFTAYTKDFVLEAGIKNKGVSVDITNTTYAVSLGAATGSVEYYAEVVDGNGNVGTLGNAEEPLVINELPKVIDTYLVADAKEYIGDEAPTCEHEGFLFSGWYADAECKNTPIASDADANNYEKVYALFVSEDVLGVKGQLISHLENESATDDATGTIRFVTSVDSKWYKEVGFNVYYDLDGDGQSEKVTRSSKKAYEKLVYVNAEQEGTMNYYPNKEFSPISKYFKACTVKSLSENYYDMDFTVEPFWITPDGITVKAEPQVKRVNDRIAEIYEAKNDAKYYEALEVAVNEASNNSTVIVFKDAEVESAMNVNANVTIQNRIGRDVTVYRGTGLKATNMFTVASGATLKIAGVEDMDSIVMDGRTVTDAEAGKKVTEVVGSTGALVYNTGTVEMKNMTAQYVRRTSGDGAVVQNPNSKKAVIKTENAKFINNSADANRGGVFYIDSVNGKSVFENTIFESNYAKGTGGAICNHSPLDITNCKFTDNSSGNNGGAIYGGTSQVVTITGGNDTMAIFSGNSSTGYGGAIGIGSGKLVLEDYKFDSNNAATNRGGAICVTGSTDYTTITECEFASNSAKEAGALHVGSSGKVSVSTSEFIDNSATTNGGAVSSDTAGAYNIYTSTFTTNSATTNGGAIYVNSTGTILVEGSEFNGNKATGNNGGAIYVYKTFTITVNTTDFKNNYAKNRGGAICNEGGIVKCTTCDFTYNTAETEGGAYRQASSGTGELISCTFENNTASCGGTEATRGGGAIKLNTGSLTIDGCTIRNNTATGGDSFGHDIKLSTTDNKPTIKNSTFNPSKVRDSNGNADAYITDEDGGGNTLVTE